MFIDNATILFNRKIKLSVLDKKLIKQYFCLTTDELSFNIKFVLELLKNDKITIEEQLEFVTLTNKLINERTIIESVIYNYKLTYDVIKNGDTTKTLIEISDNFKFNIEHQLKKTLTDNNISSRNIIYIELNLNSNSRIFLNVQKEFKSYTNLVRKIEFWLDTECKNDLSILAKQYEKSWQIVMKETVIEDDQTIVTNEINRLKWLHHFILHQKKYANWNTSVFTITIFEKDYLLI